MSWVISILIAIVIASAWSRWMVCIICRIMSSEGQFRRGQYLAVTCFPFLLDITSELLLERLSYVMQATLMPKQYALL